MGPDAEKSLAAKYPAARSFVMSSSLTEEAIHLPPTPDMFDCAEKVRTGALELERARMDERRRKEAWVKEENPYLFIKAVETVRLPTCPLKSLISQAPRLMARLGYPYPY